ncbi:MAG: amino acid adenylation domain-containing protein, partial [bacterium]|nr:amino acid adenylation domain-containing protein [bacterium]
MRKSGNKNIEDILALTPLQEGLLFHYLKDPDNGDYLEQFSLEISGDFRQTPFEKAWNFVVRTNPMLRTIFRWEKLAHPVQMVLKDYVLQPVYHDLTGLAGKTKKKRLLEITAADKSQAINIREHCFKVTLCKVEETRYVMTVTNHHILYDGWSNGIILKEFFQAYHTLCNNNQLSPPPLKTPFKEFIQWYRYQDESKQKLFWKDYLKEFNSHTTLPLEKKQANEEEGPANPTALLKETVKDKINLLTRKDKITPASIFYAAWGVLLQRYCNSRDVIFGTTVSGRSAAINGIEDMVGLFINTIPLRVNTRSNETITAVLHQINQSLTIREQYEATPLVAIKEYSPLGNEQELFNSIVVLENYPLEKALHQHKEKGNSRFSIDSYSMVEKTHYDLTVGITLLDEFQVDFNFNRQLSDAESVERLVSHFMNILEEIVTDPGKLVTAIEMLSPLELDKLLVQFNDTKADYPPGKTIHGLFEEQVERVPDNIAVIGPHSEALTYHELNRKTNQLAGVLRAEGTQADSIVAIMMERSLGMVIGIFAVLKAGGAYLPITPGLPRERIDYMLKDSAAKVILTNVTNVTNDLKVIDPSDAGQFPNHSTSGPPDSIIKLVRDENIIKPVRDGLAYVIYTSGSTGKPKGVLVEHFPMVSRLHWFKETYCCDQKDVSIQLAVFTFDVSVDEIFRCIPGAGKLYLPPIGVEKDPEQLIRCIHRHQVTLADLVPSMFTLLLDYLDEEISGTPLPLKYIITGAEIVHPQLVKRFQIIFRGNGKTELINGYGPTEAVVDVSRFDCTNAGHLGVIPIGKPIANTRLTIEDRYRHLQPVGIAGELCIQGHCLARGYLNQPGLTARQFVESTIAPGERMYRSGDLARWMPDGNIEFLGRVDRQVKVRGFRVEPGEIENHLLKHEDLKEIAVLDLKDRGGKTFLAAWFVPAPGIEDPGPVFISGLKHYLSTVVPDYMVPSYFIPLDELPLNPNGKVNRGALPEPGLSPADAETYVAPRDAVEEKLVDIWSEVLAIEQQRIGIDHNFFQLGGHSLKAILMMSRIHQRLGIKITLTEIFETPTIRGLSAVLKCPGTSETAHVTIPLVEEKEYYPLSPAQKRLYVLHRMDPDSTNYNMSWTVMMEGPVDREQLAGTFTQLIRRHESLRTSFALIDGEPAQKIHHPDDGTHIEIESSGIGDFIRPFDLSHPPLLRVSLIPLAEHKHILAVDMHHIISDGVSIAILTDDFMVFYKDAGSDLPPLSLRYKDYALWQNSRSRSPAIKEQGEWWLKQMAGDIPVLEIPVDFIRPAIKSPEGRQLDFDLEPGISTQLRTLAHETGTTPFMLLLAIFNLLLSKLSGQEDIIVGTPTVGRPHSDLQPIIGIFVNTLGLRNFPVPDKQFVDFLDQVKENCLQAFDHQDYQFENLVETIVTQRDLSRNALFDVAFTLQNITDRQLELPGLTLSPYPYETKTSKFDLTLTAIEDTDVFLFSLEYGTTLFKQETIERFSSYFKRLTDTLTQDRRQRLYQVELLSAAERRQILEDFNNTSADYPTHKTIHQLFEEQVEQVPDYIALTQFNAFTSYRELNNSADRLACYLREKGVGPGGIVGLMLERSFEMIIGIYAILKAGGSYLPIDPTYPPGRIHFMLKDSSAKIIITNVTNITNELKVNGLDDLMVIKPGDADEFPHRKTGKPPVDIIKPVRDGRDGLAYVIYTSGSTGNPKGVMIEHPSVVNRLKWMQSAYPIDKGDVVLQKTPIVFDVSVWELFWWSWEGARLCLLGPGDEKDPEEILKTISIHRVTTMHFVPPMLNAFLGHLDGYSSTIQIMQRTNRLKSLRQVFASGEALQVNQVEHFNRLCHYDSPDRPRLINLYGPTEATVDVSWYNCPLEGTIDKVPIGKPIDNIALYVFNTYFQLQPIGVVGELCIAGIGLARGYLNRPELTAEKFILAHSSLLIAHRKNKDSTQEAASNIPAMSYEPSAMSFLYKTGDLARWLPDGNIEFLGRQDHQVKIRGYRIELGEISSKLSTHEAVKDAVTMAISPDQHLTAYVVPDPETAYPICQWLELERQGIPADREYYQWPNGMTPFYLNRQETDFMYKEIFEELSYLKHGITIEDGACVIDVGANIGVFSLFIHQACRNARIYAFEPIPPVNELLSLNTRIYGVDARVFQCGVGSETGEVEFTFYPHVSILSGRFADIEDEQETVKNYMFNQEFPAENPDNLSEAQLSEMLADRLSSITFTCPIKTLSQVIRENEIDTIDLLKIDVEKSEADVLKGIDEPDWGRIRQLVVEVHDSHGRLEEITQLLKGHGYDVIAEQEEELGSTKLVNLYAKLPEARNHRSISEPSGNHSRYLGIQQFISEMKHFLTDKLPEYMVPQSFVLLEQLPLQANGKVNRKALPKPDISHSITGEYVPPADKTEEQLVEIWSEVLALDPVCIGVNHNFFQLGGHSLIAVTHANRVYKTFGVQMSLAEIFRTSTIRELCAAFKSLSPSKIPPAVIPLVEEKEYYPLSPAQKRLYVLNQMEMNSTNYNISWAAILEGPVVDREQLAGTFAQLIRRHESLRTSFTLIDGQPVQKIRRIQGGTHIEFESSKLDDFIRPFDLAHPPLLRVGLAPLAENKHMLAVDMHHIISDGVSMSILVEEFMAFYDDKGSRLPPLSLRYKDYALWQNSRAHSPEIKEQEEWWLSQMTGDIPVLELPADFPRPAVKSAKGRRLDFHLEPGISTRLKTLTHETGTTPFMVLLAIFNLLLSKLSGQEDIIVGTPTAGRSHSDLQPIIGVFINTLGLRNSIAPEKQFVQFLDQVKENCLQAFLYQDYQFEDLVETVVTERDLSRNALFDVMFTLQNMDRRDLEIPGLSLSPYQYDTLTSQFDLTLTAIEDTDRFLFSLDYGSTLFKQETIRRFISYFKRLTDTLTKDSRQRLSQVELLSIAEKRRILEEFNNTSADYPAHQTIQQLFEEQVERTPDHIAVVGPDKELPVSISYRELNDRSDHLARRLQEKGVKTGTIAGIMVPRSLAVFTGILAILKAGAAYLPIDPRYPEARISYMLKDSRSVLLLTQKELEKQLEDISLSGSNNKNPAKNNQVIAGPDDIAYVIYTSGSTGQPKGVMIEHSSVLNVLSALYRAYPFEASDVYLLKTTLVFDVSVSELFGWFWGGGRLAILEPGGEQDPSAITAAIRRFGVTHINFVPSMFSLFVNLLKSESIDQSAALKYIFLAGEALLPGLVEKSSYLNEKVAIENIYGPTEATVYASRYSLSQRTGKTNIPIGKPLQNTRLYILDGGGRLQPIGIPGELCIAGAGVARGYLNRPELTAEKFDLDLIKELSAASAVIYRTGDSARWLADGNIEFLGRIDHQVKVRGFRIEPGEIENHLLKHEKVMEAVVPALKDKNGDTFLAAYFVPAPGIENSVFIPRLKEYLLTVVPDYMVPSYFISIDELPLTPSGKIDRGALPKPGLSPGDAEAYAAPRDDVEEKLADIWSDVLSPEQQRISIHHNFFQMGGHSLNAILLTSRIHQTFNVKLPLTQVFKHPTIAGISRSIREAHREDHISIPPCEARQYYPLSPAQKRLYVLHQMEMNSTNYNISWAVMLEGHIDRERLTGIFPDLIRRHESLRTSFHLLHGEPLQKIHNDGDFEIESLETDVFVRPFDLSRVPLLRVNLLLLSEGKHELAVDMHHIISDGVSMALLVREFMALYNGDELPPLSLSYKDYALWQISRVQSPAVKTQKQWWLNQMEGEIPVLELPIDFPRPAVKTPEGSRLDFEIGPDLSMQLNQLADRTGTTPFMVLLSLFNLLLSKLSGQEDIIVGTPTAGRPHNDLQAIIGVFINTLALRNFPSGEKRFSRFLREVKENALQAFENQDYQFEDLVDTLVGKRDLSRNSIFDVMFVFQNTGSRRLEIPGLELTPYDYQSDTSKFDLTLTAMESGDRFVFSITYSTKLFKQDTIRQLVNYFKRLTTRLPVDDSLQMAGISLLSDEEKLRLLTDFNGTQTNYPTTVTIHREFETQVQKTPHHIAVVHNEQSLTYHQLNERSNQSARLLRRSGLRADTIAGLLVDPSLEMLIGILSVLKAGGAYLPIDPLQPAERVRFMLNDSRAVLLLTTLKRKQSTGTTDFGGPVFTIDDAGLYNGKTGNLPPITTPEHVVYTIYTSGTSGQSKGALVQNGNLVNYVYWLRREARLTSEDRALLTSSFGFDLGYSSLYPSILSGCPLNIIPRETWLSAEDLTGYIIKNRISYIKVTPSLFSTIVESPGFSVRACPSLRLVILGGEAIKLKDLEKAHAVRPGTAFINHYGPTEATIGCVAQPINFNHFDDYLNRPVIGRPIPNMKAIILDKGKQPVPPGVPGELCVSGAGVIRGYLNRPELTAEKFIPHPYLPGEGMYLTGDLARWLSQGTVEFLGRIDSQVKIRGYRVELAEIENRLLTHQEVEEAAVIQRENPSGDNYLCAYVVPLAPHFDTGRLREHLAASLPDYMIPSSFVTIDVIPLTANGKLNRGLLPEPETHTPDTEYAAPRDKMEETLVKLRQEVLGLSSQYPPPGIDDDFFRLGGHSLNAIILVSKIHKHLDIAVSLTDIFRFPTVRNLARRLNDIKSPGSRQYTAIEPVEEKEYYPLSPAQKRLYALHLMEPDSTNYNIPRVVILEGPVDRERLARTFGRLIHRHESLRTSFALVNGESIQQIHGKPHLEIESSRPEDFIRPFDLSHPPLLRVSLVTLAKNRHILATDMHHIVSDGVSTPILLGDFMALYEHKDSPLSPLNLRYKDYAQWQNSRAHSSVITEQKEWWLKQMSGDIPVLELPVDFPRPAIKSPAGGQLDFQLESRISARLRALTHETGTTLFMVLMAIFNLLLSKLSGQEDIIVGTPTAGRPHNDLQDIIGVFINTLPLRNFPSGDKSFSGFLSEVKENALQAFLYQDYQFEDLVETVVTQRDLSRNALFDVMLNLQNTDARLSAIPGLTLSPYQHETVTSKFDLILTVIVEDTGDFLFSLNYGTTLFKQETIERFINYFIRLTHTLTEDKQQRLS